MLGAGQTNSPRFSGVHMSLQAFRSAAAAGPYRVAPICIVPTTLLGPDLGVQLGEQ